MLALLPGMPGQSQPNSRDAKRSVLEFQFVAPCAHWYGPELGSQPVQLHRRDRNCRTVDPGAPAPVVQLGHDRDVVALTVDPEALQAIVVVQDLQPDRALQRFAAGRGSVLRAQEHPRVP